MSSNLDTPEIFAGIPDIMEISYRQAIESYVYLQNASPDEYGIEEHIDNLKKAMADICHEISSLRVVRKLNKLNPKDSNLQLVSRMGVDENGNPKYIFEKSPEYINPTDRNGNAMLFIRDLNSLTSLHNEFQRTLMSLGYWEP
jgi:hypothetical protein